MRRVPDDIPAGATVLTNSPMRGPLSIEYMREMEMLPQSTARQRDLEQDTSTEEPSPGNTYRRPVVVRHPRTGTYVLIVCEVYSVYYMCTCMCALTQTHTHTYRHTHMHTHTHTHTHTRTHTQREREAYTLFTLFLRL